MARWIRRGRLRFLRAGTDVLHEGRLPLKKKLSPELRHDLLEMGFIRPQKDFFRFTPSAHWNAILQNGVGFEVEHLSKSRKKWVARRIVRAQIDLLRTDYGKTIPKTPYYRERVKGMIEDAWFDVRHELSDVISLHRSHRFKNVGNRFRERIFRLNALLEVLQETADLLEKGEISW